VNKKSTSKRALKTCSEGGGEPSRKGGGEQGSPGDHTLQEKFGFGEKITYRKPDSGGKEIDSPELSGQE